MDEFTKLEEVWHNLKDKTHCGNIIKPYFLFWSISHLETEIWWNGITSGIPMDQDE